MLNILIHCILITTRPQVQLGNAEEKFKSAYSDDSGVCITGELRQTQPIENDEVETCVQWLREYQYCFIPIYFLGYW